MTDSTHTNLKIISLGLGVQSTAMYILSSIGKIPRADDAIFADPGSEHPETYDLLRYLTSWWLSNRGIPISHVKKSLLNDLLPQKDSSRQRFASIPAFTEGGAGMLRRQCTKEYKIDVVMKEIRNIYGLKPRKRMPMTEVWLGISTDEVQRMTDSKLPRVKYVYPLVDIGYSRSDCQSVLKDYRIRGVVKSACTFCPYQSDYSWKRLKISHPKEFQKVIDVDNSIRDSSKRGIREPIYLHRSCKPIGEVDFESQQDMFDEQCDGYCGL